MLENQTFGIFDGARDETRKSKISKLHHSIF